MKEAWNYGRCVSVLNKEIELLKNISAAQDVVRQTVMNREWADFDEKSSEVNRLGAEFALLEDEREEVFSSLAKSGEGQERSFYARIMDLPHEERAELSRLYRELKMETIKIGVISETFTVYLNEARTLAASYLETVCPGRCGKLYTRKGRRVSQDLRSIVINNSF